MPVSPLTGQLLQQKEPQSKIDQFFTSPGGSVLLNILAQQGHSLTPGPSPLGVVGRAGLAAQQQGQQREQLGLRRQLIESQIGLNNFRATEGGLNATAGNVQSTFKGDNGNMFIVSRSGKVTDTGVPFSNNLQLVEQADGSVIAVDRATGQSVGTPVSPEQARQADLRNRQQEASFTLPTDLASLDSTINTADATIAKIKEIDPLVTDANVGFESRLRGDLPGALGGGPRKLKQQVKSLQANFGFDTLQKMRAASKTGGALGQVSERELDLLINALRSIDIEGDVDTLRTNLDAVVTHYENYKREIEIMKNALRDQAGKPTQQLTPTNKFEGFSIATDES